MINKRRPEKSALADEMPRTGYGGPEAIPGRFVFFSQYHGELPL